MILWHLPIASDPACLEASPLVEDKYDDKEWAAAIPKRKLAACIGASVSKDRQKLVRNPNNHQQNFSGAIMSESLAPQEIEEQKKKAIAELERREQLPTQWESRKKYDIATPACCPLRRTTPTPP